MTEGYSFNNQFVRHHLLTVWLFPALQSSSLAWFDQETPMILSISHFGHGSSYNSILPSLQCSVLDLDWTPIRTFQGKIYFTENHILT